MEFEKLQRIEQDYKNQVVPISNSMLRAREKANLLEGKLELLAIQRVDTDYQVRNKIDAFGQKYKAKYVTIPAKEIKLLMDREDSGTYNEIRLAAFALKQKLYIYEDAEKHQFVMKNMYGDVMYDNGKLEVEFNPDLEFFYLNLKRDFTKLPLSIMFSFSKNGGFQLYKQLKSYAYDPNLPPIDLSLSQEKLPCFNVNYSLTDLRMQLGYIDINQTKLKQEGSKAHPNFEKMEKEERKPKYKRWADFNNRVIKPGIKEINDISDIYIKDIVQKRGGRGGKINGVVFIIQHNKAYYERKNSGNIITKKSNVKIYSDDEIDVLIDELKAIFKSTRSNYKAILQYGDYNIDNIKVAYEITDVNLAGDDFLNEIKKNIDVVINEYNTSTRVELNEEEKDKFIDWVDEELSRIGISFKSRELKEVSEESEYNKLTISNAIRVLDSYPAEIKSPFKFLIKAIKNKWSDETKSNNFHNFKERDVDWNQIAKELQN